MDLVGDLNSITDKYKKEITLTKFVFGDLKIEVNGEFVWLDYEQVQIVRTILKEAIKEYDNERNTKTE